MGLVVTFEGYKPPPRGDGKPYTHVLFERSSSASGPWTPLPLIALVPLDTNPAQPFARPFTIEDPDTTEAWYRATFIDADGDQSLPTQPVQHGGTDDTEDTYLDLDTLGSYLGRGPAKAGLTGDAAAERARQDEVLASMLAAAYGDAATITGRQLAPLPASYADPAYVHRASGDGGRRLRVPDLRALTAVRVGGVPIDPATVVLIRNDGEPLDHPAVYLELPAPAVGTVEIEGRFGFRTLPDNLLDAIYTDAARRWQEKQANYSNRVEAGPQSGGKTLNYFGALHPRTEAVYDSYRVKDTESSRGIYSIPLV